MNMDRVISHFKTISRIPRASGDEKRISDFILEFAQNLGLETIRDDYYNVIVKKPASACSGKDRTVILQGHLDMVYVKKEGSDHRYEDGIEVLEKDGYFFADGTTLGADNGIAVAYCMALMESKDIPHPNLEFVLTTREEVGLQGADHLDVSPLKGTMLLNLDSEEEGIFYTSCAGGLRSILRLPVKREQITGNMVPVQVEFQELMGGHSGTSIGLERGNAIVLAGRLLNELKGFPVYLASADAPGKANAIAVNARLKLYVEADRTSELKERLKEIEETFIEELRFTDKLRFLIEEEEPSDNCCVYTKEMQEALTAVLMLMPYGVINHSFAIEGLIQTSINLGSLTEEGDNLELMMALRSSVQSQKYMLRDKIAIIAKAFGAEAEFMSDYPGWTYREDSPLRDLCIKTYEEMFGKKAVIAAIHAGLECGYFDAKIPGLDIVSLGSDLFDVHTPGEKAGITSMEHMWELIVEVLRSLAE